MKRQLESDTTLQSAAILNLPDDVAEKILRYVILVAEDAGDLRLVCKYWSVWIPEWSVLWENFIDTDFFNLLSNTHIPDAPDAFHHGLFRMPEAEEDPELQKNIDQFTLKTELLKQFDEQGQRLQNTPALRNTISNNYLLPQDAYTCYTHLYKKFYQTLSPIIRRIFSAIKSQHPESFSNLNQLLERNPVMNHTLLSTAWFEERDALGYDLNSLALFYKQEKTSQPIFDALYQLRRQVCISYPLYQFVRDAVVLRQNVPTLQELLLSHPLENQSRNEQERTSNRKEYLSGRPTLDADIEFSFRKWCIWELVAYIGDQAILLFFETEYVPNIWQNPRKHFNNDAKKQKPHHIFQGLTPPPADADSTLILAIKGKSQSAINFFLNLLNENNFSHHNRLGETALTTAIKCELPEFACDLITHIENTFPNVDRQLVIRSSPLHPLILALEYKQFEVVKLLAHFPMNCAWSADIPDNSVHTRVFGLKNNVHQTRFHKIFFKLKRNIPIAYLLPIFEDPKNRNFLLSFAFDVMKHYDLQQLQIVLDYAIKTLKLPNFINLKNYKGKYLLLCAIALENLNCVKMLVEQYGANVNHTFEQLENTSGNFLLPQDKKYFSWDGDTPIRMALKLNTEAGSEIARYLLQRPDIQFHGLGGRFPETVLHIAVKNDDKLFVEAFLKKAELIDFTMIDAAGFNVLELAHFFLTDQTLFSSLLQAKKTLIERSTQTHGVEPFHQKQQGSNQQGNNSLFLLIAYGQYAATIKIIQYLALKNKEPLVRSIKYADVCGITPLLLAVVNSSQPSKPIERECIELLLQHGANIWVELNEQYVSETQENDRLHTDDNIIDALFNCKRFDLVPTFLWAAFDDLIYFLGEIIIHAKTDQLQTVLQQLKEKGKLQAVINLPHENGIFLLLRAVLRDDIRKNCKKYFTDVLISHGADVNQVFSATQIELNEKIYKKLVTGDTPLRFAVKLKSVRMVRFLLKYPNIQIQGVVGELKENLLHLAVREQHIEIVELVLEHCDYALLTQKNSQGQSPLDLARALYKAQKNELEEYESKQVSELLPALEQGEAYLKELELLMKKNAIIKKIVAIMANPFGMQTVAELPTLLNMVRAIPVRIIEPAKTSSIKTIIADDNDDEKESLEDSTEESGENAEENSDELSQEYSEEKISNLQYEDDENSDTFEKTKFAKIIIRRLQDKVKEMREKEMTQTSSSSTQTQTTTINISGTMFHHAENNFVSFNQEQQEQQEQGAGVSNKLLQQSTQ